MNCPACKSELVIVGQKRLETLLEHVDCREPSLKDDFACSSPECPTHAAGVHWNENGETYCRDFRLENEIKYIDDNDAPFGSFQRQLNVEIYKHDENFTLITIFGWKFNVEFKYKSDEDGNILKRWWKLVVFKPDHTLYIPGIHMFFYMINKKNHPSWMCESNPLKMGNEWWRHAAAFFIYAFDRERYLSWSK
jgi:uncharacterized protein YbaR (Trm112 family)